MTFLPLPTHAVVGLLGLASPITLLTTTTTPSSDGFPSTTTASSTMQAIVQPISGRDVERATGGRRTSAGLLIQGRSTLPVGSRISYRQPGDAAAKAWLIVHAEDWRAQGGFHEAIAIAD